MAVPATGAQGYLQRAPAPSGLADVIDAYVRVSVIGIEVLTIDARIVIASVDTYLRFAEAVNRLDLTDTELHGLPELQEVGAKKATEGAIEGAEEEVEPDSPGVRKAMKGLAAGAAAAGAAAATKVVVDRVRDSGNADD